MNIQILRESRLTLSLTRASDPLLFALHIEFWFSSRDDLSAERRARVVFRTQHNTAQHKSTGLRLDFLSQTLKELRGEPSIMQYLRLNRRKAQKTDNCTVLYCTVHLYRYVQNFFNRHSNCRKCSAIDWHLRGALSELNDYLVTRRAPRGALRNAPVCLCAKPDAHLFCLYNCRQFHVVDFSSPVSQNNRRSLRGAGHSAAANAQDRTGHKQQIADAPRLEVQVV